MNDKKIYSYEEVFNFIAWRDQYLRIESVTKPFENKDLLRKWRDADNSKRIETKKLNIQNAYIIPGISRKLMELEDIKIDDSVSIKPIDIKLRIAQLTIESPDEFEHPVTVSDMEKRTRKQYIVKARMIAMFIIKEKTSLSLKGIGEIFGGRDHSTVINAIYTVKNTWATDIDYRDLINPILYEYGISLRELPSPIKAN